MQYKDVTFSKDIALEKSLRFANLHFVFFTNSISYQISIQTVNTNFSPKSCSKEKNIEKEKNL